MGIFWVAVIFWIVMALTNGVWAQAAWESIE